MSVPRSAWFVQALPALVRGEDLSEATVLQAFRAMTSGEFDESEAAAFLVAMSIKGESGEEIRAAALALRERMVRLDAGERDVLDTCGTGGDGSGTFNISTAVALVIAATGCPVVKHGNRSVSSRSGSADVLQELGVPIEKGSEWARECMNRFHFAFCFAPHFHPALAAVAPLRRKLGVRTIFNLLGPLLNPAGARYQLLGVGKRERLDALAEAARGLGVRRAFLVCSEDGLDEISLSSVTHVRHVASDRVESLEWRATDFGLQPVLIDDLKTDGPAASAAVIRGILAGKGGPAERIVLANAAAGLHAAQRVDNLPDGVQRARAAIHSGAAMRLLEELRSS
jgi:anthranilate phosphoribosyltransferase